MLSRSGMAPRSSGESQRSKRPNHTEQSGGNGRPLNARVWGKVTLFVVLAGVSAAILLLNTHAVVEPSLRLPLVSYARPGLVLVLVLTSVLSIGCTLAFQAVLHARKQAGEARGQVLTATVEREASRIKHGPAARTHVPLAPSAQPVSVS